MNKEDWLEENLIYDYQFIGDNYFIGKYNVMFGTRVRGGKLFDCCDFDICCGTVESLMDKVIKVYKSKIEENLERGKHPAFELKRISEIKPIFNDKEYMNWFFDLKEKIESVNG